MHALRSFVSAVTALAFFAQTTGLAFAAPPQGEVQPVPYAPSQPVPAPPPPPTPSPPPALPPLSGAPAASVQARPGGDAVYLKGGGVLRGTLLEMLPNDHATIQPPTGPAVIVEWGRIDRIERQFTAGQVPVISVVGALGQPGSSASGPQSSGSAFVHVEADQGVVLESLAPGSALWAALCTAPCDAEVPLGDQFRVSGQGIRRSHPFGIAASPGQHVVITVSPASRGGFAGGIALLSTGAAAIGIGLIVLFIGASGTCPTNTDDPEGGFCDSPTPNSGVETAGAIVTVAGIGLLIGGIVLLASNTRTREKQTITAFDPTPHPDTAWLRSPTWHDAVRDSAGGPKAMGFPLFTHSF